MSLAWLFHAVLVSYPVCFVITFVIVFIIMFGIMFVILFGIKAVGKGRVRSAQKYIYKGQECFRTRYE